VVIEETRLPKKGSREGKKIGNSFGAEGDSRLGFATQIECSERKEKRNPTKKDSDFLATDWGGAAINRGTAAKGEKTSKLKQTE